MRIRHLAEWSHRSRVRAAGVAGIVGAFAYVAGDVLMLGSRIDAERHPLANRPDVDEWAASATGASTARLTAGAFAGVYATPLQLAAIWHLYQGLEPAGRRRALPPALMLAGAWSTASFLHGMFLPHGESYRAAAELDGVSVRGQEILLRQGRTHRRSIAMTVVPFGITETVASVAIMASVARGETAYPRWAAPLVAPAVPVAVASALVASPVVPRRWRAALRGTGISLGHLVSWSTSTALLWRRARP